jgi:hypothetical protein
LRHLAGAPRVVDGLDDLVALGELSDEGGDLEDGVVAGPGLDADVEVLVHPDDGGVGALAADVDADPDALPVLEVGLAGAGARGWTSSSRSTSSSADRSR